ncbi:hypothetical protein AJ80_09369 [Polytolypa hystricis UAMH7299]|uniref:Tat pathway signal sequence n=1 Tax=Polytolypa hystricis (strain UAMH7299) TaxID=1447883 RepID=A0A2B7WJ31_POLH7|nr:hypothetical protein AJ80_09369 [Polytolypa hystricis UAMH7299]
MPQLSKDVITCSADEEVDMQRDENDSEKRLLSSSEFDYQPNASYRHREPRWFMGSSVWIILLVLNLTLFCMSVAFFASPFSRAIFRKSLSDQDLWKETSFYSPILDRYEMKKVARITNGSLYDTYPPSILRVPKGEEADKEWYRIGTGVFPIIISSKEVINLGKDPATAVKVPEEYGFGSDAYIAQTDVFHHLHCLDMLRKKISYDHYYRPKFGDHPDAQHEAHISHCIDLLAQAIKCSSSTDMITFNWVEGWDQPFPDFRNQKTCREFEGLLEWVNKNSLPVDVFQKLKAPPEGYVRLPEPAPELPPAG